MSGSESGRNIRKWMMVVAAFASVAGCNDSNSPAALRLLGADGAGGNLSNLYVLNEATGAVKSTIGPIGFAVTGLALDPNTGTLYGVTGGADPSNPGFLITINMTTGAGTIVGDLLAATTNPVADITFTSDGTLYGWSENTDDLVTINKTTGAATVVANSLHSTFGSGIAASAGDVLYFAGDGDEGDLTIVDKTTGLLTTVATMDGTTDEAINALAFNGSTLYGSHYITSSTEELITINTTTAVITVIGPTVNKLDAIVFAP